MIFHSERKFPHRHNPDGTYDSICTICFATVDTERSEAALEAAEQSHVCDRYRVATQVLWWTAEDRDGRHGLRSAVPEMALGHRLT